MYLSPPPHGQGQHATSRKGITTVNSTDWGVRLSFYLSVKPVWLQREPMVLCLQNGSTDKEMIVLLYDCCSWCWCSWVYLWNCQCGIFPARTSTRIRQRSQLKCHSSNIFHCVIGILQVPSVTSSIIMDRLPGSSTGTGESLQYIKATVVCVKVLARKIQ